MIGQARKTPGSRPVLVLHRHADKALTLLPDAKVIHLMRDPRDVARSAIGMGWAGNVFHGSPAMVATEAWAAATTSYPGVVHEGRYGDLVALPRRR